MMASLAESAVARMLAGCRRLLFATALGCALLTVACTDEESTTSTPSLEGTVTTSSAATSSLISEPAAEPVRSFSTATPAPQSVPSSIDEYRRLWTQERNAIIDQLGADDYGLGSDGVLRGPGGFMLDTNQCPEDWTDSEGVNDGVIELVHTAPLTNFSNIGDLVLGAKTYFDRLNANGGIGPDQLQVDLQVLDDAYIPDQTMQIVNEALAGPTPFAFSTMGTLTLDAINDLGNEQCLPLLMGITNSPLGADPAGRPWTTSLRLAQNSEAILWAEWIERNADEPVTVAALVMDNSFGYLYETAFADVAAQSELIERFEVVRHAPSASDLSGEMTQIAALEPDVYISMTAGNPCVLAIRAAADLDLGASTPMRFTPLGCSQTQAYMIPIGAAADGWLTIDGGIKDPTSDQWVDDPWVEFVKSELKAANVDRSADLQAIGFGFRGWAMHQILEIAANLDGGLTRTNLILAQRGLTGMTHPMLHPGVEFAMNGNQDAYFVEGSPVSRYDAGAERWVTEDIIDVNGSTPACSWQSDTGLCTNG